MHPLLANTQYYQSPNPATDAAAAGLFLLIIFIGFIIVLVAYALQAYLLSRIFKKAGVEGWKAWVPIYNNWTMLELGNQKGWWAVLSLIPLANLVALVFKYIAMYHIGLKLRKEGAFVLLGIFIPLVWYVWLAFDSSTWKGKHAKTAAKQKTD